MADDVRFEYRLPLTYVRITGSRTTTTDELAPSSPPTVSCQSVVTTETGADLMSRYAVRISPGARDKQQTTWNLLPDGRLTGADVTTTVERHAALKAALTAGGAVLGAAAPALLTLGPPGWLALGGATIATAAGAAVATSGMRALADAAALTEDTSSDDQPAPSDPEVQPSDWDVHELYVAEKPHDAQVLATCRAILAQASAAHRRAAWAVVQASDLPTQERQEERVAALDRIIRSVSRQAAPAEAAYATWKAAKVVTSTVHYDERLRVDDLPDAQALEAWLREPSEETRPWMRLATQIHVVVTVELQQVRGSSRQEQHDAEEPPATDDRVRYRQPRPATVTTWKLTTTAGGGFTKERQTVQHALVAFPGNEAWLTLRPRARGSGAVAVSFDDGGGLAKVTTDLTAPAVQRAQDVSDLVSALSTGATTGKDLREALAPPSLADRAAEAEAAEKLGLVPTPEDPLKKLKEELAEQELRTRIRIAEQLASAATPPVVVSVSYPSDG